MTADLWAEGRDPGPEHAEIIIPVWNQVAYTRACLDSLAAHTLSPHRVIVVDNGSTDGTAELLRAWQGQAAGRQVIANATNRGFTRAANQGLAAATGRYVVLLNNDTTVLPGWLTGLICTAETDDRIGLVGPKTLNPATSRIHNIGGVVFYQTHTAYPLGRDADRDDPAFRQIRDCQYVEGSCLLVKRRVLETIGLLDETFAPGYYEDSDFCFRAREAGFRCVYSPLAEIYHHASVTATALPQEGAGLSEAAQRNERIFRARWAHRFLPDGGSP